MRKAKKEQIQAIFENAIEELKKIGVTNTDCVCYKCRHSCMAFLERTRCNTCEGHTLSVFTNFEDLRK